ncbi:MAG: DUF87 domain-containing protein [Phycisphaerae bacterium]|nr:DUF87 domain-containing protein [Phycisphaerae bacterium]
MSTFQERRQVIRGCVILFSLIVCAFLWIGLLSFDTTDWPSPHVWPHPDPALNAAGRAGAWVAYHMFVYFGSGAYAAVAGITLAIGVLARQGRLSSLWQRVLGISLLIAVTSTTAHLLTASEPPLWPELRGGVLGYVVANWLQDSIKWMTLPALAYSLLVGLLFTSEGLLMRIPQALRARRDQIQNLTDQVRRGLPKEGRVRRWAGLFGRLMNGGASPAKPALAGGSAGGRGRGAAGADIRINPSRRTTAKERAAATAVLEPPVADQPEDAVTEPNEVATADEPDNDVPWDDEQEDTQSTAETPSDVAPDADDEDESEDENEDEDCDVPAPAPEPRMIVNFPQPPKPEAVVPVVPPKPYPTELAAWEFPSISLLDEPEYTFSVQQEALVREKARILEQSLLDYRLEGKVVEIDTGPVITMFEVQVAPGVKVSQVSSLANDIARALKAPSVRVVAPIPGKNTIGIEVPNLDKEKVRLKELMTMSGGLTQKMQLPLFLGKDASGGALVGDLTKMPHMLIAGTTGSGKSVCINSIIASLLMTQRPDMVKLILVDPKMVEMSMFRDVPHLMCPIVTEMERAEKILEWATVKMDERYALLAEAGVRNITAYNRLTREEKRERFQPSNEEEEAQIPLHLPYIVILIDELADLMMMAAKEVELHLSRLAQKSRAIGIHIIVATQRPEAKIVTGLIKSNLPCRIAFRVASRLDSRIVLDQIGAEVLMGQGDMLYLPPGSAKLLRCQGTYLEDSELKSLITWLKERGQPEFHPELIQIRNQEITADGPRDELFDKAVEVVLETRRGSVSLLQRRLTVGYSRASRLIEEMAAAGIVGEYKGSQAREVLITPEQWQALKEQEAARIRSVALEGDGVPDDIFDDDID